MRYIILIICLLGGVAGVRAEDLSFDNTTWNFGTIEELGGSVSHTFTFKNESSKPVVIHRVNTSCGCTTPEYVRRPIIPGDSSTLTVTFDPRFRPGQFKKSIYVYTTASNDPILLYIEGRVLARELTIEERYPYSLPSGGRYGVMYLTIRDLKAGELMQSSVEYYNGSNRAMELEFRVRGEGSGALRLFYDEGLAAGKGANVDVGYYIDIDQPRVDVLRDTIDIYVNGKMSGKSIFLKGVWSEDDDL